MPATLPLFSVILPVFNRLELIERSIYSILNQKYTNFELIIVDDGSTDGTADIIKRIVDPRIQFFQTNNQERAAARNFGANKSKGRFLNFFDSDDWMYPLHLSAAADFLSINPSCVFFHHGYETIDVEGKIISVEKGDSNPIKRLIKTNYLGCNSVFISRQVFNEVKFNPDRRLASSEDWDLWLKIISRYPLMKSGIVTFQLINHSGRSLFKISADQVIVRDKVLTDSLMADEAFTNCFKNEIGIFKADRNTFFALCLIIEKRHQEAFRYLFYSLDCSLKVLTRKRFWACVKNLVMNQLK